MKNPPWILAGVSMDDASGGAPYKASNPFTMGYGNGLVKPSSFNRKKGSLTNK